MQTLSEHGAVSAARLILCGGGSAPVRAGEPPCAPGNSGCGVRPPQPLHGGRHLEVLPHRQAGPQRALLGTVPQEAQGRPSGAPREQHLQRQGCSHVPSRRTGLAPGVVSVVRPHTWCPSPEGSGRSPALGKRRLKTERQTCHALTGQTLSQFGLGYQVRGRIQGRLFGRPAAAVVQSLSGV